MAHVAVAGLGLGVVALGVSIRDWLGNLEGNFVGIVNKCNWEVVAWAKSGDDDIGPKHLQPGEVMYFHFEPNIWGTTHFWGGCWSDGRKCGFPCYAEGAPNDNNVFEIMDDGVYLNGSKFRNHESA